MEASHIYGSSRLSENDQGRRCWSSQYSVSGNTRCTAGEMVAVRRTHSIAKNAIEWGTRPPRHPEAFVEGHVFSGAKGPFMGCGL